MKRSTEELKTKQFAYSLFTVKSIDEERREIEGWATTPSPDRVGDVVLPMGAQFELPLPLLWQHRSFEPVGHVIKAKATKEGIPVTVKVFKAPDDAPASLKERLELAWHSVKMKLVRGFSIGFVPIKYAFMEDSNGIEFQEWDWLELSLVTIPANIEATIDNIKSVDRPLLRAALGAQHRGSVVLSKPSPGAAGIQSTFGRANKVKTIKEQLEAFNADRKAALDRMTAIMGKAAEESRTLDETESAEYDELQSKVKALDSHISRLEAHEKQIATSSGMTPVPGAATSSPGAADPAASASASRSGSILSVSRNLPKGTAFTRYAIALAASKGQRYEAIEIAKRWQDTTPEVGLALKAAVDPGTSLDATWAAPLAPLTTMATEFIDLLRPATIIGRMPGFRRVPFNISMPRKTAGSSAGWVGQGAPKPVSELAFDTLTLGLSKIAGIVVLTSELVRISNPAAEGVVRQDMIDVISQFSDQQFIDPTVAAVANVSPASVTNGVTPRVSTGATVAAVTNDVQAVMATLANSDMDWTTAAWVMRPATALHLSMLRTAQDVFAFPGISITGGVFFGLPVIVSNNVPLSAITGDSSIIALVVAGDILLADDGAVTLDVSTQASLQMATDPSAGAQALVSLWQNNLIGLKAERFINWQKRRTTAVGFISEVQY